MYSPYISSTMTTHEAFIALWISKRFCASARENCRETSVVTVCVPIAMSRSIEELNEPVPLRKRHCSNFLPVSRVICFIFCVVSSISTVLISSTLAKRILLIPPTEPSQRASIEERVTVVHAIN